MQKTFEENPFFEMHAFSHYFSKALGGVSFKNIDHTFDLALSIASMDIELFKSFFADLKKADMETVKKFIGSLDDQAMTALSFIIKMAEIEPYLVHTEENMENFGGFQDFEIAPDCPKRVLIQHLESGDYDYTDQWDGDEDFESIWLYEKGKGGWIEYHEDEEQAKKEFLATLTCYDQEDLIEKARQDYNFPCLLGYVI